MGTRHVLSCFSTIIAGKKNIDALHVKCTNGMGSMACNWIGRFCALEEHSAMCSYARAPCPYKCKDDNNDVRRFNKRILGDHMAKECPNREHTCQNCGEKDTYAFITEVHDEVCKKKMVPCPNVECVSKVQRRGVKRHLDVCSYTEIPCKYAKLGCDTTMKRSIITEHQCDDQAHFRFAMNTVVWLEKELKLLKQRGGLVLQNGASTTFKMTRYQQRKDANEIFSAPHFSTSDGHFVVIQVHANGSGNAAGQHLSIITQVSADGNRSDGDQVPFNGNITIQLLNQLTNDNHHMKTGRTVVKFIAANKLALNSTKKTQYLKDDTLYFKVTIDIPNQRPWLECTAS